MEFLILDFEGHFIKYIFIHLVLYRSYQKVAIPKTCTLRFEVWDEDLASPDDFLGRVDVEFDPNGIKTSGMHDQQEIELELKDKKSNVVERKMDDDKVYASKLKLKIDLHHRTNPFSR